MADKDLSNQIEDLFFETDPKSETEQAHDSPVFRGIVAELLEDEVAAELRAPEAGLPVALPPTLTKPVAEERKDDPLLEPVAAGPAKVEAHQPAGNQRHRLYVWFQRLIGARSFARNPLFTNASFIWGSRILRSGLTFVFWLVAARLFPKEAIGLAGATISVILLLGTLSSLGLMQGIIRFLPESDHPRELINTVFKLVIVACALVSAIFSIGIDWWSPALAGVITDGLFPAIFIVLAMGNVLHEVLISIFVALRIAYNNLVIALIGGGLRIGLIFVVAAVSLEAMSLVAAYNGALLLAVLIGVLVLLPRCLPGYRLAWKSLSLRRVFPMLRFSAANSLQGFLWSAPAYLFPMVVINIQGEQAAADFYIAWLLTNIMTMFPASLATSLFAEGSNASHRLFENTKKSLWGGLLVTGICAAILSVLARPVLMVFGEEYSAEAVELVRILSLAVFVGVIPTTFIAIARVKGWLGSLIGISTVRVVVALGVGAWLTTIYGPFGLGIAWVGTQVLTAGIAIALTLSKTGKSAPDISDLFLRFQENENVQ